MRGMPATVCDTSLVDPIKGLSYRDILLKDALECLPRAACGDQPLPEGLWWFLLTGEIPTEEQAQEVSKEWVRRASIPYYVMEMLSNFPRSMHPMTQLSCAMTSMGQCSAFRRAYSEGKNKLTFWEYAYEDSMDIIARVTVLAAYIYNRTYNNTANKACVDIHKDWSWNFAQMLGYNDDGFADLLRMYMCLHADHEGANVSAHTCLLVSSALSDPYISWGAGISGLAGPIHGSASEEVVTMILDIMNQFGSNPSEGDIARYVTKRMKAGKVLPGFGHGILRAIDPRYVIMKSFAKKHIPDMPMVKIAALLLKVVPELLKKKRVANPFPNVDGHSGLLLHSYGMDQKNYYTVMFAVARSIGALAQLVLNRGLGVPIERPKSLTTRNLMKKLKFNPSAQCQ